jgi:tetratricopeptide (TPR) repeat protein
MTNNNLEIYYQILELKTTATLTEIKQAYRQKARKWHPDRFVNHPENQQEAEEKFKEINQAYDILKKSFLSSQQGNFNQNNQQKQTSNNPDIFIVKKTPEYFYNLGVETAQKENYEESLSYFARAIKLNPEYLEAFLYRKKVLEKLGFENRAKADSKKILEIELNLRKAAYQKQYSAKNQDKSGEVNSPWQNKISLKKHSGAVSCLINYHDQFMVSGSYDKTIKVWNFKNFSFINNLKGHSGKINSIDISKNGKILISGSNDKTIKIWDIYNRQLLMTLGGLFSGHSDEVLAVKFTFNDKYILSSGKDKTIKLWDIVTRKEVYTIKDLLEPISSLTLSPDCQKFASVGGQKYVIIRNIYNGKINKSIKLDSKILALAYHPHESIIAVGCENGLIHLFNTENKSQILKVNGHFKGLSSLIFINEGKYLISAGLDNLVIRWDLNTGKQVDYFQPKVKGILSLASSLDHKTLILGTREGIIYLWFNEKIK